MALRLLPALAAALASLAVGDAQCMSWGDDGVVVVGAANGTNATTLLVEASGPGAVPVEYTAAILMLTVVLVFSLALVAKVALSNADDEDAGGAGGGGVRPIGGGCGADRAAPLAEKKPLAPEDERVVAPIAAAAATEAGGERGGADEAAAATARGATTRYNEQTSRFLSVLNAIAALPGAVGMWCWSVMLALAFGIGGGTSSLFMKHWFSLAITTPLLGVTLTTLRRGAAGRRGTGPFSLACGAAPCMLVQPMLLALQSIEPTHSFFAAPPIFYAVTTTTWIGVAAVISASLWNASVDRKLARALARWRARRAAAAKISPRDEEPAEAVAAACWRKGDATTEQLSEA